MGSSYQKNNGTVICKIVYLVFLKRKENEPLLHSGGYFF